MRRSGAHGGCSRSCATAGANERPSRRTKLPRTRRRGGDGGCSPISGIRRGGGQPAPRLGPPIFLWTQARGAQHVRRLSHHRAGHPLMRSTGKARWGCNPIAASHASGIRYAESSSAGTRFRSGVRGAGGGGDDAEQRQRPDTVGCRGAESDGQSSDRAVTGRCGQPEGRSHLYGCTSSRHQRRIQPPTRWTHPVSRSKPTSMGRKYSCTPHP